ncbi:MAG: hypothetical protein GY822_04085 [Deltaproteobacteria bacterium]|nr:hypothetical protein [Deltaproteobacteria bacterium]
MRISFFLVPLLVSLSCSLFCSPALAKSKSKVRAELEALKAIEPTVEETQEQSLRFFKVHPDKVNAMRAGASWKAIVPFFEVSGGGTAAGINETTLLDEYQPINRELSIDENLPWIKRSSQGQTGELRMRMAWNLPNLLFNPEELDVASLMVAQKDVISTITQLFYECRRLQLTLIAHPPADPAARITMEMRIEELTARLTGMTGGWFQRELDAALAEPEDEDEES